MPHKILVVEDDIAIQGFCQTVLESAGFSVKSVSTATEGLKSFQEDTPDMVILDIGLPDGNGLDLGKKMGLGPECAVSFLFLTARQDLNTRLDCFQSGAQDYIQKPFAVEELLARVKVHLKVKKSHDELVKRNYELELRQRARQDLTDMLVHDLKAPLTSIKGTLELIKARGLISDDAYKNLLEYAGTAAEFMLLMLNDLLDIGQAATVGLKAEIGPADMTFIFDKLGALFEGRARKLGVTLERQIAADSKTLDTDQNLVFRILANLIQNALKVSDKGGKVQLSASRKDGVARFTIADRGPGVPSKDKERIFEKYTTTSRKIVSTDSGSGVGLTFCRLAAAALKGKVWVDDRPGGGSLFMLEFPIPAAKA
ncbi:MAG: hybrid sensor histidine kinase/response regulator [Elusimicrobia bacterium]|nr:hybrid sensor histidine kinase/response regulator [Elusimicrobiota bacterium]